jgi:hypothetical protein
MISWQTLNKQTMMMMMMREGLNGQGAHGRPICTLQTVAHTRKRKVVKFSFNGMPKESMPSQPRAHRLRVPDAGEKRMWSRLVAYGQAHGSCCRLALAQITSVPSSSSSSHARCSPAKIRQSVRAHYSATACQKAVVGFDDTGTCTCGRACGSKTHGG